MSEYRRPELAALGLPGGLREGVRRETVGEGGRRKKRGREIEIRGERTRKEKKKQRRRRKDRGKERENGKRRGNGGEMKRQKRGRRRRRKGEERIRGREKSGRKEGKGSKRKSKGRTIKKGGRDRERETSVWERFTTCAVMSVPAPAPSAKWLEKPSPGQSKTGTKKRKRLGRWGRAGPRGRRWAPAAPRNGLQNYICFLVILLKVTPHLQIA